MKMSLGSLEVEIDDGVVAQVLIVERSAYVCAALVA